MAESQTGPAGELTSLEQLIPVIQALVKGGWLALVGQHWIDLAKSVRRGGGHVRELIRKYQVHFGLPATGVLCPATRAHILLPRVCGHADTLEDQFSPDVAAVTGKLPMPGGIVRWYWTDPGEIKGLLGPQVLACYDRAWGVLKGCCGIDPQNVLTEAEADCVVTAGAIDGALGTLAWSELGDGRGGVLHQMYDSGDRWVDQQGTLPASATTIDLGRVAMHECIHLLGFGHDDAAPCLMNSIYSPTIDRPNQRDIDRLQKVYGPPKGVSVPVPVEPPKAPPPADRPTFVVQAKLTPTADGLRIELPGVKVV